MRHCTDINQEYIRQSPATVVNCLASVLDGLNCYFHLFTLYSRWEEVCEPALISCCAAALRSAHCC